MINVYKSRTIFFLFGIILIINTVLMSMVFFAYSTVIKKDYEEKLTSVAGQIAANANRVFSFFEEEIEVFVNKYNVEEGIGSFKFDAPNFVRMDSTSFEKISIFKGNEPVYASSADIVSFYRETEFDKKIVAVSDEMESCWIINEEEEPVSKSFKSLIYVRTLFDSNTSEKIGCVVAEVSQNQLIRLLDLRPWQTDALNKEFLPHSLGILVDGKIFFPREGSGPDIVSDTKSLKLKRNEMYFANSIGDKSFFTIHDTEKLKNKIHMVLALFILLYLTITLFSYRMLKFMVNEIYERIDNLNRRMEMHSILGEDNRL